MNEDLDREQLREEFGGTSAGGDRLDTAASTADTGDLKASIVEALEEIDAGERQKTVSVWDGNLAALFAALEDHDEALDDLGGTLQQELGEADGEVDRSEVLRLAVRYALRDAAPEYVDVLRDAVQDHAASDI